MKPGGDMGDFLWAIDQRQDALKRVPLGNRIRLVTCGSSWVRRRANIR